MNLQRIRNILEKFFKLKNLKKLQERIEKLLFTEGELKGKSEKKKNVIKVKEELIEKLRKQIDYLKSNRKKVVEIF